MKSQRFRVRASSAALLCFRCTGPIHPYSVLCAAYQWYHVTATYDGLSSGLRSLLINGQVTVSTPNSANLLNAPSGSYDALNHIMIGGGDSVSYADYFQSPRYEYFGQIDDVRGTAARRRRRRSLLASAF
jgi:hypothetical protein